MYEIVPLESIMKLHLYDSKGMKKGGWGGSLTTNTCARRWSQMSLRHPVGVGVLVPPVYIHNSDKIAQEFL